MIHTGHSAEETQGQAISRVFPQTEYSIYSVGASGQQTPTINCQMSLSDFSRALRVSINGEDPPQSVGYAPLGDTLFLPLIPELRH